jgi:hypothetical protein
MRAEICIRQLRSQQSLAGGLEPIGTQEAANDVGAVRRTSLVDL